MKLWHNGVLTANVDKTIEFLCAAGGDKSKWTIMEIEFPHEHMVVGNGGKLRAAFGRAGDSVIELLEPLDDNTYHAIELKKRGPGFHHNAYICEENMDAVVKSLLDEGGQIVWEFKRGDEHACYVQAADKSAVIEIINHCPFMP